MEHADEHHPSCHPERSEGSIRGRPTKAWILHFVQNDKLGVHWQRSEESIVTGDITNLRGFFTSLRMTNSKLDVRISGCLLPRLAFVGLGEPALEDRHGHAQENRCSSSRPNAQMPRQTRVSLSDGRYSTIAPSGVGMKPGMTRPMPFSIQMPTMHSTQATLSHFRLRLTRQHEQHHRGEVEGDRGPDPRHQRVMAVQAEEEVF